MADPYTKVAKVMREASEGGGKKAAPSPSASSAAPSVAVVGRKYMDPQSRSDEEYMAGAQKRINERLMRSGEKMSGEYRSRRYNDRRFGRRSGR